MWAKKICYGFSLQPAADRSTRVLCIPTAAQVVFVLTCDLFKKVSSLEVFEWRHEQDLVFMETNTYCNT